MSTRYNTIRSQRYLRTRFQESRFLLASEATDLELELIDFTREMLRKTLGNISIGTGWKVDRLADNQLTVRYGESWFDGLLFLMRSGQDQLVSGSNLALGTVIGVGGGAANISVTDAPDGSGKILTFNSGGTTPTGEYQVVLSLSEEVITAVEDEFLKNFNIPENTAQKLRTNVKFSIVPLASQTTQPIPYTSSTDGNLTNTISVISQPAGNGSVVSITPIVGSEEIDGRDLEIVVRNNSGAVNPDYPGTPVGNPIPTGTAAQAEFTNGRFIDSRGNTYHLNLVANDTVANQALIRIDKEVNQPDPVIVDGETYTLVKRDVFVTDSVNGIPEGQLYFPIANIDWNSTNQINHQSLITDLRTVVESEEVFRVDNTRRHNVMLTDGGLVSAEPKESATGTFTITDYTLLSLDTFEINGVNFVEGTDFSATTSNDQTAQNLAEAINASSDILIDNIVQPTASTNTVTIDAISSGTTANSITTSYTDSGSGVGTTADQATLAGGTDSIAGQLVWDTEFKLISGNSPEQTVAANTVILQDNGVLAYQLDFDTGGAIEVGNFAVTTTATGTTITLSGSPDLSTLKIGNTVSIDATGESAAIIDIDQANDTLTVDSALSATGAATVNRDTYANDTLPKDSDFYILAAYRGSNFYVAQGLSIQSGSTNQSTGSGVSQQTLDYIGSPASTDDSPNYSSTNLLTQGDNLTSSIGILDSSASLLNTKLVEGGYWSWDLANEDLSFDADAFVHVPGLSNARNTIQFSVQSPITLQANEVAYVDLTRDTGGAVNLTVNVATISALTLTGNRVIIARREGSDVLVGRESFRLRDKEVLQLDQSSQVEEIVSIVTANGTTTLDKKSKAYQRFTGAANQNVDLPDATTLPTGKKFVISNRSSGIITIRLDDTASVTQVVADHQVRVVLADNTTSNGVWDVETDLTSDATDSPITVNNAGFTVGLAANAATINLKDKTGSDPSGASAVDISFRDSTITTGLYNKRSVSSALSIVIPSTATLGHRSNRVASGTLVILDYTNLALAEVIVNGVTKVEGTDWTAATDNATTATSLASAISAISGVSASSTGEGITVLADTAGGAGNDIGLFSDDQSNLAISGLFLTDGFTATEEVHVYAIDNAGTVELAVSTYGQFDEEEVFSTEAISTSSDNRRVLYSTVARSNVPVRLIGSFISSQDTAGSWTTALSNLSALTLKRNKVDTNNGETEVVLEDIDAPFNTVTNRAKMTKYWDLKPMMGVERVQTQDMIQIFSESGPNGEPVYKPVNDKFNGVRFYGNISASNNSQGASITMTDPEDIMEISFYGTGLNILGLALAGDDLRATIDSEVEGSNFYTSQIGVLNVRNYSANVILPVAAGLNQGLHTIKIRHVSGIGRIAGFEVLNESSTIKIPAGAYYHNGTKRISAETDLAYNSGFTTEEGSDTGDGGKVVVYQKEDGSIEHNIKWNDDGQLNLGDADHSQEEVIATHFWREFGAGRGDDFSTLTINPSDRAFTLDDGTTSLVGDSARGFNTFGVDSIFLDADTDFYSLTFVGTGLDVSMSFHPSGATAEIFLDGGSIGDIVDNTGAPKIYKIVSGLSYGTHIVKIQLKAGSVDDFYTQNFYVYGPKKPTFPIDAVELGNYNLMADFVAVSSAGELKVARGVLAKTAIREFVYEGGSIGLSFPNTTSRNGVAMISDGSTSIQYTHFCSGFDFRANSSTSDGIIWTVEIDEGSGFQALNTTNFPSITKVENGITYNLAGASSQLDGSAFDNSGGSLAITGLVLNTYTFKFTPTSGTNSRFNGIDFIIPIHSPQLNGPSVRENTIRVGSGCISDSREFSKELTSYNSMTAVKWTGADYTDINSTISPTPWGGVINTKGGKVLVTLNISHRNTSAGDDAWFYVLINGKQFRSRWRDRIPSTTGDADSSFGVSFVVDLPEGESYIQTQVSRDSGAGFSLQGEGFEISFTELD